MTATPVLMKNVCPSEGDRFYPRIILFNHFFTPLDHGIKTSGTSVVDPKEHQPQAFNQLENRGMQITTLKLDGTNFRYWKVGVSIRQNVYWWKVEARVEQWKRKCASPYSL